MERWKAEVGRVREEKSRSETIRDGESQKKEDAGARKDGESQKKEDAGARKVGKSQFTVFFQ